MKKILIICLIVTTILNLIVCWNKFYEPMPIVKIAPIERTPTINIHPLIEEFNLINSNVLSFNDSNVVIKFWENGMRFKITGSLFYEKPNHFRMRVASIMGKEMDFGSNDEVFWYWSRRDRHPGLYYACYEDYYKTRLKTPFNPIFLRESLGLDQIDVKDVKITESVNDLMLTWKKINTVGQEILYSIILNKSIKRITGIIISNLSGEILASCEVQYQGDIPKKIIYNWQEEQVSLVLEFQNPNINNKLNKDNWLLPNYSPKINMGLE